jgi:two-component system sensor histidine kinase YesM
LVSLKRKYADMSIKIKFMVSSVFIISFLMIALVFSTRILFTKIVMDTATENYVQKFQTISDNFMWLFSNTEQLTDIVLTDTEVQYLLKNEDTLDNVGKLQSKMKIENYLDFLDSAKSTNQFSSISVLSNSVDIITTNNIRNRLADRYPFYKNIQSNKPKMAWIDLYASEPNESMENRISFIKPVIDYTTGISMGYVMIDINHDILLEKFSDLSYGHSGKFLVTDREGNIKMNSETGFTHDFKSNISGEPFYQWASQRNFEGKVFQLDSRKYLITSGKLDKLGWIMFGMIPLDELTAGGDKIITTIYIIGIIALILAIIITQYLANNITKPIMNLSHNMKRFGTGDFNIRVPLQANDEIGILSKVFNNMISQISELVEQVTIEQRSKSEFEFAALQAQISPHFLYNTLSSVCSLISLNRNAEAFTMINAISTFYRTVLSSGKNIIPIRDEIENIQSYIMIQTIRYGDKISYKIEVDETLYEKKIVKFTLQPIVENAIYHGIKNREDGTGLISVIGRLEDDKIILRIQDNGVGIAEECIDKLMVDKDKKSGKTSFGLTSIDKRIKLYFGEQYGVTIASEVGFGTSVTIRLPIDYE